MKEIDNKFVPNTKLVFSKLKHLSIFEYCLVDYIHKLSTSNGNKKAGWCYMSKKSLASMLGVDDSTIYRTIKKLVKNRTLEKNEQSYLRAKKWIIEDGPFIIFNHAKMVADTSYEESAILSMIMMKSLIKEENEDGEYIEKDGYADINISKMAKCLNMKRTSVHRIINNLIENSLLEKKDNSFKVCEIVLDFYAKITLKWVEK